MANNNSDQFDDPSFQTQKLPKDTSNVDQMFERAKPQGTEDKRVKAMEEAVKKAKAKNQVAGASTQDEYSSDQAEKQSEDHQKVVNTVKLKRATGNIPPPPATEGADMTMKIKNVSDDDDSDGDEGGSLLGWQHWLLLVGAVGVTGAVVYLLLLP
jgi:hypothetical protein